MNTIIGIDIGGTSISASTYSVTTTLHHRPTTTIQKPLIRGLNNILTTITELVDTLSQLSPNILPILGVGTAGQLINNLIAPHSAYNLEAYPTELDHINMAEHMLRVLPKNWRVRVENDAITQGIGILLTTESPQPGYYRYIGIGTGLGAATFRKTETHITPLTDNDLAKLSLPVFPHDPYFSNLYNTPTIAAESILSGPGFAKIMTVTPKEAAQNATLLQQSHPCITIMGEYLGELIHMLAEKESNYTLLLGGSLATEDPFAAALLAGATHYLDANNHQKPTLIIAKNSKNCGTLGAAYLAYDTYN